MCFFARATRARQCPPLFLLGWKKVSPLFSGLEKKGGGAGKTQQPAPRSSGWWIVFGARGARALAARARMFVTSRVPFFPNQQYKI